MIDRGYLIRQTMWLLKFAKSTKSPELAAVLVEKAADFKAQIDETPLPDRSPKPPDVECPAG